MNRNHNPNTHKELIRSYNPADPDYFLEQERLREERFDRTVRAVSWFMAGVAIALALSKYSYRIGAEHNQEQLDGQLPAACVQWWFDPEGSNPQRVEDARKFMCQQARERT